ncbi:CLUMA_CG001086, isoform A [Clunio marinus]|uniref:CLUMA_CG001086, isoform A n=1 Tax=Clunio marinus TaxID=568069 RepID=A0A1J1HIQ7_9DIPT|nr:CLUMA_CG001086, isoform A [Clunio marinus]
MSICQTQGGIRSRSQVSTNVSTSPLMKCSESEKKRFFMRFCKNKSASECQELYDKSSLNLKRFLKEKVQVLIKNFYSCFLLRIDKTKNP